MSMPILACTSDTRFQGSGDWIRCDRDSRQSGPCSGSFNMLESDTTPTARGQIVQSQLDLDDSLRAPWKGALSLRVRIPPGSCRSSR